MARGGGISFFEGADCCEGPPTLPDLPNALDLPNASTMTPVTFFDQFTGWVFLFVLLIVIVCVPAILCGCCGLFKSNLFGSCGNLSCGFAACFGGIRRACCGGSRAKVQTRSGTPKGAAPNPERPKSPKSPKSPERPERPERPKRSKSASVERTESDGLFDSCFRFSLNCGFLADLVTCFACCNYLRSPSHRGQSRRRSVEPKPSEPTTDDDEEASLVAPTELGYAGGRLPLLKL